VVSEIAVREEAAIVVALKPMVEMDLIEVRRRQFLPEFVRLAARKRNLQSRESCDQRLSDPIRVCVGARLG
jgi:hypothetical protein